MSKLSTTVVVRSAPADRAGRVFLDTPYDEALIEKIKRFPGAEWDRGEHMWLFPHECVGLLEEQVSWQTETKAKNKLDPTHLADLYPYHQEAVEKALVNNGALISYEMGLGKTPVAIKCLKLRGDMDILIVCPAFVRTTWVDELKIWWPGRPPVTVVETSKTAKTLNAHGIVIISYELLSHVANLAGWQAVIFDESSYIKNGRASRSKAARIICIRNSFAFKLLLTGTPIDTEPKDLHHQLDCLHPGRWGSFWQFAKTYCLMNEHRYGLDIRGVNPVRAPELASRLASVSIRKTKAEPDVAKYLPGNRTVTMRVKPTKRNLLNQRALSDLLSSGLRKQHDIETHLAEAGSQKDDTVIELVKTARESGEKNIVVATHLRASADRLAKVIYEKLDYICTVIDGDIPGPSRRKMVRDATLSGNVLVATMHSIGIGINDLAQYTTGIVAELYWRPLVISQLLGRLNRMSSKLPSVWYIPVVEGSLDEPIVSTLKRRMKDQEKVYKPGVAEESLLDSFEMADEDWASELSTALGVKIEDPYL